MISQSKRLSARDRVCEGFSEITLLLLLTLDRSRLFLCSWNAAGLFKAGKTNEKELSEYDRPLSVKPSVNTLSENLT